MKKNAYPNFLCMCRERLGQNLMVFVRLGVIGNSKSPYVNRAG